MKKLLAPAALALMLAILAGPAGASTQTIDATLSNTVSMTTTPDSAVSGWSLASTGSNQTSGGTMTVNANSAYTVTVTADKSAMTEYITASSAYETTSPKTLSTALSVIGARTGGTAPVAGTAATAVIGTSTTFATGLGSGTDDYSVTLSQPTVITDKALAAGRTYHIQLTYTASSAL